MTQTQNALRIGCGFARAAALAGSPRRTRAAFTCALGVLACGMPALAGGNGGGGGGGGEAGRPPMYTMIELDHLLSESMSIPYAISDVTLSGGGEKGGPVVVGESFSSFAPPTLSWRAVAWRPQASLTPIDLLTIAQAGDSTVNRANDVSPSGQFIAGYSSAGSPHGIRWRFDPATGTVISHEVLNALPGDGASEGVGINGAGRVAGYSLTDSSTTRGATWAHGSTAATLLQSPPGSGGLRLAREISEAPQEHIVGRCDMSSTPTTRPIIWKQGGPPPGGYGVGQLLEHLSPLNVHDAVGIRPDGAMAVGLGATATAARGVGWDTLTNEVIDLGGLCCSQNVVFDMNNSGTGVGYVGVAFEVFRATLFWQGQAYDLNDRIVNNPDIGKTDFLHVATGINSAGQIVGKFGPFASGEPLSPGRVFILTPVPEPVIGDITGDGEVDIDDLLAVIAAWGPCPPPPTTCPADIAPEEGDGTVDIDDLLLVISHWG